MMTCLSVERFTKYFTGDVSTGSMTKEYRAKKTNWMTEGEARVEQVDGLQEATFTKMGKPISPGYKCPSN